MNRLAANARGNVKLFPMTWGNGISIQPRDVEILSEIAESPACSRNHIALALFDGRYEAAKKRVQQLAKAGLVANNDRSLKGRSILRITQEGLEIVGSLQSFDHSKTQPISPRMHQHEKMLADVRFALKGAAKQAGFDICFRTAPEETSFSVFCADHGREETVRPDALAELHRETDGYRHTFFLEIDRSTETQGHLIHLGNQYRSLKKSRRFIGEANHPYDRTKVSFRVLLIVRSRQRMTNSGANFCRFAGINTLVWITTIDEFLQDPFGAIWQCPVDFKDSGPPLPARPLF